MAKLGSRLNGIQEARGSNPLISTTHKLKYWYNAKSLISRAFSAFWMKIDRKMSLVFLMKFLKNGIDAPPGSSSI
jgi:hypothetical protein